MPPIVVIPADDVRTAVAVLAAATTESYRFVLRSAPDGVTVAEDGRWLVPVVRGWASRDDAEALAAGIALNRGPELGGGDAGELASVLGVLADGGDFKLVFFGPCDKRLHKNLSRQTL